MAKLKAKTIKDADKLEAYINKSQRFQEMRAWREDRFFDDYAQGLNKFINMSIIIAMVIGIGGIFTGVNTIYTAVTGRIREIGMLQVIGFSKNAVVVSFILESLMISVVGGLVGCFVGYMFDGAVVSLTWFAFKVKVDGLTLLIGFATAIAIGFFGALFPAIRGVKMRMVDAMRYN